MDLNWMHWGPKTPLMAQSFSFHFIARRNYLVISHPLLLGCINKSGIFLQWAVRHVPFRIFQTLLWWHLNCFAFVHIGLWFRENVMFTIWNKSESHNKALRNVKWISWAFISRRSFTKLFVSGVWLGFFVKSVAQYGMQDQSGEKNGLPCTLTSTLRLRERTYNWRHAGNHLFQCW